MKIFMLGLCLGIIGGLCPFLMNTPAHSVHAEWQGNIEQINSIAPSPFPGASSQMTTGSIPLRTEHAVVHLKKNGEIKLYRELPEQTLFSMSKSGEYFVTYEKIGDNIIFYNSQGEQFWKHASRQYPRISANGRLLLLLVADLSAIYVFDYNGNPVGVQKVSGRICTNISFSRENDHASIGFLNGTFYVIDEKGENIFNGVTPEQKAVKSMALSSKARFLALHYGDTKQDGLSIINLQEKKSTSFTLPNTHTSKTALHVTDNGIATIINKNRFLMMDHEGNIVKNMPIPLQKEGQARITHSNKMYAVAFRRADKGSFFFICKENGDPLLQRTFPDEPYLDTYANDDIILARGLSNLFCWSFE